jgi:hypothetical protein
MIISPFLLVVACDHRKLVGAEVTWIPWESAQHLGIGFIGKSAVGSREEPQQSGRYVAHPLEVHL